MFNSFEQAVTFINENGLSSVYGQRVRDVLEIAWEQEWLNAEGMENLM